MGTSPVWPLSVFFAAILALVAGMLGASALLGPRHREAATDEPFESGVVGVGQAPFRFPAKFYMVAVAFVIFDIEAVYLLAWAIAFRGLGWTAYGGTTVFVGALAVALAYLWRMGALDWGPARTRRSGGR